jgi:hypothetical protein
MINTILFPSSYFSVNKVDEDLQAEYEAAVATGLWETVFFDYNQWFNGGKLVLSREVEKGIHAVYRGWMMKEEQYRAFYAALQDVGVTLVTSPKEYLHFHYFPNVYEDIRKDTPGMIAVPDGSAYSLDYIQKRFDRFMVKDYVKSVKGTDFPKCFTKGTTDEEFHEAMKTFFKYRGNLFSGGICFKEYVDLATYDGRTNEYRVFYVNNEVASVSRNSLQQEYTATPPDYLIQKYKSLASPFYTLDFAELANGCWKILEAGDGSVSGPSEGQNLKSFYRAISVLMN